ncbi:MAG: Ni/Fe hydrogenase subunit alpha [Archaeoglobaceae archaeon]|nr:Ni/Fe hydrogenase subunit alpha [Archaeoglobaceae archaeon]MCX8152711.1 Ni/Fe hydrogenase subunit alpha [Archaeoglobaceae archaeon]MDW8013417.1 Ni/Fe hydrogenase subunit alpha [Archaeoglobaceae archaeon]
MIYDEYVTQIEGHGKIHLDFKNGNVEVRLEIHEGSRLFESFLRGRRADEVPQMVSRICGVCPVPHNLAAVQALENAMGIEVSEQVKMLRRLAIASQIVQSHALHLYVLAAADYLGVNGVSDLYAKYPEAVKRCIRIRAAGNRGIEVVGGRAVHPINSIPGGFAKLPTRKDMEKLVKELKNIINDCIETFNMFANLKYPKFERPTEYLAIDDGKHYPSYSGKLVTSRGLNFKAEEYRDHIKEFFKPYSNTKFCTINGHGFHVGAIARINVFKHRLNPIAKELLESSPIKFPSDNPFHNNLAQAIEIVHYTEEAIKIAEELSVKLKDEVREKQKRSGTGVGVVEAPRGTLIHEYTVDDKGIVRGVNLIIPTGMNTTNIEEDLYALLIENIDKPKEELKKIAELLFRAYDPCLSCSTH